MSKIIAGRFIEQAEADAALEKLVAAGFARDKVAAFFVNSPGKHDLYPTGGDEDESPGTGSAGPGAAAGAAGGGAIGAAAGSILGPAGALAGAAAGAYVGSLPGALDNMEKRAGTGDARHTVPARREREAGMMLAVVTPDQASVTKALQILRSSDATDIEQSEGEIRSGEWIDFDPLATPNPVPSADA
jgi:hypothetical protein